MADNCGSPWGRRTLLARFRSLTLLLTTAVAATLAAPVPALAQSDEDPIARFEDPLCPGVAGLTQDAAEAMVGRIRANAEALGLRLAQNGDCRANLDVAFVKDGHAYLSRLEANARTGARVPAYRSPFARRAPDPEP